MKVSLRDDSNKKGRYPQIADICLFHHIFEENISQAEPISHTAGVFHRFAMQIYITAYWEYPYAQYAKGVLFVVSVQLFTCSHRMVTR